MSKPSLIKRSTTRTICSSVAFSSITMIIRIVGSGEWGMGIGNGVCLPTPYSLFSTPFLFTCLDAFDPSRLVNHALEEAADGLGVEWACVRGGDVGDDLRLPRRRIDLQSQTFFDVTDFDGALRPFVEEFDQFEVDLINTDAPIFNRLFAVPLFTHRLPQNYNSRQASAASQNNFSRTELCLSHWRESQCSPLTSSPP